MARWKGNNGKVERTSDVDLTGTSFNERSKTNTRNLDDMITYLEYGKDSVYEAARVSKEQEEHWAMLLRHLLMDKVIDNLIPLYEERLIIGVRFTCLTCGLSSEMKYDHLLGDYTISKDCNCNVTKLRKDDIIEYLEYIIQRWCKVENLETVKS